MSVAFHAQLKFFMYEMLQIICYEAGGSFLINKKQRLIYTLSISGVFITFLLTITFFRLGTINTPQTDKSSLWLPSNDSEYLNYPDRYPLPVDLSALRIRSENKTEALEQNVVLRGYEHYLAALITQNYENVKEAHLNYSPENSMTVYLRAECEMTDDELAIIKDFILESVSNLSAQDVEVLYEIANSEQ